MEGQIAPASPKQEMILENDAQILVIGGAAGGGKSYLLQMLPLLYVDDPNTNCIMFRRTTPQLKGQGGLIDTARSIYNKLDKGFRPKFKEQAMEAVFPSGARVKWSHMEHENDRYNSQGLQFTLIGFDEGTQFTWTQIEYLMSRMRSESKHKSRMVISCNPDPFHKIRELLEWFWLDEEGYPIPEHDGVIKYFIRKDGDFVWGHSKKELGDRFDIPEEDWDKKILSFSFISATIYDNPPMLENNPEYLAFLEGLNEVDKARLLFGNWHAVPQSSGYIKREWFKKADKVPLNCLEARGWDKAASEPSDVYKYPDFTASIKMSKSNSGDYYIQGNFCNSNFDKEDPNIKGRFRRRAGDRDNIILSQAKHDGEDCHVVFPVDAGAAGKLEFEESSKKLSSEGFVVKKDPMPTQKSKLTRFTPFASAVENGFVYVVESSFPDRKTLEDFYKELEAFDGERSTNSKKDDWSDSCASVFNYLSRKRPIPSFTLGDVGGRTKIADIKKNIN